MVEILMMTCGPYVRRIPRWRCPTTGRPPQESAHLRSRSSDVGAGLIHSRIYARGNIPTAAPSSWDSKCSFRAAASMYILCPTCFTVRITALDSVTLVSE